MFPIIPANTVVTAVTLNDEGIFGFGYNASSFSDQTNKVSNVGVVASDVTGVGSARYQIMGTEFGGDQGIFAFGYLSQPGPTGFVGMTNLVSNSGVVSADVTKVGVVKGAGAGCEYGGDKGIFALGYNNVGANPSTWSNLVSNTGVMASDLSLPGGVTARNEPAACEYGTQTGIFGFGTIGGRVSITNLVSSTGVIASDQAATTGTVRSATMACSFGEDKGIFGYGSGSNISITNLVSNTGVVADDVAGTGTARNNLAACEYGQDLAIIGFGHDSSSVTGVTNLVSNVGVVASDTTGVGTARYSPAACSFN